MPGCLEAAGRLYGPVPSLSPTPLPHHAWTGRSQGEEGASQAGEGRTPSTAGADMGSKAVRHWPSKAGGDCAEHGSFQAFSCTGSSRCIFAHVWAAQCWGCPRLWYPLCSSHRHQRGGGL